MSGFEVHGAWTRRSATIDGGAAFETQFAVWLQAGSCYADLRVPLHPDAEERCFAGRGGWDGEEFRWTHQLDLEPGSPADDDIGSLVWEADALIERGLFPTPVGPVAYEEVWIPRSDGSGPYLALLSPSDAFVRVGCHAIGMSDHRAAGGGFAAAYWRRHGLEWRMDAAIGDGGGLGDPGTFTGDALEPGWVVVEEGVWDAQPLGVHR